MSSCARPRRACWTPGASARRSRGRLRNTAPKRDSCGSIPLVTEADPIGGPPPKQVARDSMYRYVVSELRAIVDSLPTPNGAVTYGRATPAAANMLLAELYLNAQVYSGTP